MGARHGVSELDPSLVATGPAIDTLDYPPDWAVRAPSANTCVGRAGAGIQGSDQASKLDAFAAKLTA